MLSQKHWFHTIVKPIKQTSAEHQSVARGVIGSSSSPNFCAALNFVVPRKICFNIQQKQKYLPPKNAFHPPKPQNLTADVLNASLFSFSFKYEWNALASEPETKNKIFFVARQTKDMTTERYQ